ncbi:flagellar hook capping FlgD N-terminal domain-containing protein [Oscillospiraceae bacterium MB08-C2-2]|nr:flagellar hook capping FlgD N-terminal domain-containing protein [Oscillospiraceae bacterium MB08-C2-2]
MSTAFNINDYMMTNTSNKTKLTTDKVEGKDSSKLDMDDFFKLLVAQMTNQDMMNPVNDTEFIAQMAQFTALQGIQSIQQQQLSSYAASYVGKSVTIADTEKNGDLKTIAGVVESVTFYDGSPRLIVGGKSYDLYKVMEIKALGAKTTDPDQDKSSD